MANTKDPIGIDFGTTNSTVATVLPDGNGRLVPRTIQLSSESHNIPSAVYINDDGSIIVGNDALLHGKDHPEKLFTNFKRDLATDFDDTSVTSPNQLALLIFGRLLDIAKEADGNIDTPVICHPVGERWRKIIVELLDKINVKPITITEPEAVLNYTNSIERVFDENNETVLLIDFGGGTCDFLLLNVKIKLLHRIFKPDIELIDEDRLDFGGKDIDELIRNEIINSWKRAFPTKIGLINDFNTHALRQGLLNIAKEKKELLSRGNIRGNNLESVDIHLSDLPGNTKLDYSLTYSKLKLLSTNVIKNKFNWLLFDEDKENHHMPLLGRSSITRENVTLIILAGGSSQFPWLNNEILPDLFPILATKKKIILLKNPELAVAYGAALYSHDIQFENNQKLLRFLMHDIRIELEDGGTFILAKKGTKLPIKGGKLRNSCVFQFPHTGNSLQIKLVEGEDYRASLSKPLSYKDKRVDFTEEIKINTWMRLDIEINIKGEITLSVGKNSLSAKKYILFFNPAEANSIKEKGKE